MENVRLAAVRSLIALASSESWQDRADAGAGLALFADVPRAREPLLTLVLDPRDTHVTRVTAQALLERRDAIGIALVAHAIAVADDNHADWIHTAVHDVFCIDGTERDTALRHCRSLFDDTDERIRAGARHLVTALSALNPAFRPR